MCTLTFRTLALGLVTSGATLAWSGSRSNATPPERPLAFVENFGQADARAELVARTRSGAAFLTREGVVLDVRWPSGSGAALRMRVVGGAPTCVEAEGELPSRVSYFRGADPLQWKRGLRTWSGARQRDVYPGIDLVYHGSEGALEHDFIVAPGADPAWICVAWEGAQSVTAQPDGSLHIDTGRGVLVQRAPVAWEERGGARRDVKVRQVVDARGEVGYEVGERDPSATLVIDPLVYSTYLGGRLQDSARAIEVGANGEAWVGGWTWSPDFPTTLGAFDQVLDGEQDLFIVKFTAAGELEWSTFLEGGPQNCAYCHVGLDVDEDDSVFVAAQAGLNFPVTSGAFDPTFNSTSQGDPDGVVAHLDATGSNLLFGTYLGGVSYDSCLSLVLDQQGRPVVVGRTSSRDFPTTYGVHDGTLGGSSDLFLTKLESDGSRVLWSTYLGGSGGEVVRDGGTCLALDSQGNAYVTGDTSSTDFPLTPGAPDTTTAGNSDAFVSKLSPDGASLVYSTYLGGRGVDQGCAVAVDAGGRAYVTGMTNSRDFPATQYIPRGGNGQATKAFVTAMTADGTGFVYSTLLGGRGDSGGSDIKLNERGEAYVLGSTLSHRFPVTPDAYSTTHNGPFWADMFLSQLTADGSALVYSTYFGGTDVDEGFALALESDTRACFVGETRSTDYPLANAFDLFHNGTSDGVVTKLDF